eukprot:TRINITY_DN8278_c0_g1_i3.p1 TRINITY_DN8278_c0_g1~~TRINITY_DN8278_c0_g1_i3.p1  ORF type:complete len:285 (-),score=68.61 TRINITY_DN8278_c0_g1_i3:522-1376(-)
MSIRTLLKSDKAGMIDNCVIETTGIADPAPIVQMFYMDEEIKASCSLDAVICLVDSKHVLQHLEDDGAECARQIAFADRVFLNKTDLASEQQLREVQAACLRINATAKISRCTNSEVPLDQLLSLHAFDPVSAAAAAQSVKGTGSHSQFSTVSLQFDKGCFDLVRFNRQLGQLLAQDGPNIFRAKGIIHVANDNRRFVFQGVHMVFDGQAGTPWEENQPRRSVLVFIGRSLDKDGLRRRFESCLDGPGGKGKRIGNGTEASCQNPKSSNPSSNMNLTPVDADAN